MQIHNWKKEVFTIPNLLSMLRLMLIPVYTAAYLRARDPRGYVTAGMILALSCLTDLLDGMIARRFHMTSLVGRVLDPAADKATQLILTLCLSLKHPQLRMVLWILLLKETVQLTAGVLSLRKGRILEGALLCGKLSTAVFFTSLVVLVLFPGLKPEAVSLIAWMDGTLLAISLGGYMLAYLRKPDKFQDLRTNE